MHDTASRGRWGHLRCYRCAVHLLCCAVLCCAVLCCAVLSQVALRKESGTHDLAPAQFNALGARLLEKVRLQRETPDELDPPPDAVPPDSAPGNASSKRRPPEPPSDLAITFPRENTRFALRRHTILRYCVWGGHVGVRDAY